ncbi:hypothetical protein [Sphingosinicella sp. BN140058]|uniref:hypothetical protein n=1 Tax=Sphingosinicella sp. BN140058 TaxID=1892855 RepID=UPI0013ED2174|nr:hypothetical protein [Sphingosinicella sp. BN140058]
MSKRRSKWGASLKPSYTTKRRLKDRAAGTDWPFLAAALLLLLAIITGIAFLR